MSGGLECPYDRAFEIASKRIDNTYARMKEEGMDTRRLKLTAICTVCISAFPKEVNEMDELLRGLQQENSIAKPQVGNPKS